MANSYDYLLQADGGSRGNPGIAGYGAVIYDADGTKVADIAGPLGKATNNVAEYSGLVAGLELIHSMNPEAVVHVQLDSKLVVEQMCGRWKIKHPDMQTLARRAHKVFPSKQVTYEWIARDRNTVADKLSNEAMDASAKGIATARIRRSQPDNDSGVQDQSGEGNADFNSQDVREVNFSNEGDELVLTLKVSEPERAKIQEWLDQRDQVQRVGSQLLVSNKVRLIVSADSKA